MKREEETSCAEAFEEWSARTNKGEGYLTKTVEAFEGPVENPYSGVARHDYEIWRAAWKARRSSRKER